MFVGSSKAKCLALKQPLCKSKVLVKMKATMTTNPKEKLTTTYFHNKVVMASKN
jgi:DNA-directed RNA polymerase subunit RPC12/RpoP